MLQNSRIVLLCKMIESEDPDHGQHTGTRPLIFRKLKTRVLYNRDGLGRKLVSHYVGCHRVGVGHATFGRIFLLFRRLFHRRGVRSVSSGRATTRRAISRAKRSRIPLEVSLAANDLATPGAKLPVCSMRLPYF